MRGMILAAGRGLRMGDLTVATPKPLLRVANRYLIEYSIDALLRAGIREIVINISYRGDQIKNALGDGSRYGAAIYYSEETEALETGGGIFQALPLLGEAPFVVLSADIISDYPLQHLSKKLTTLAHLVLVDNPTYHLAGDFCLEGMRVHCDNEQRYTYANIGIYRPELFAGCQPGKFRLSGVLAKAISEHQVTGEYFKGPWVNIGTAQELAEAEQFQKRA